MESHWLLPSHALHKAWVPCRAQTPSKYFQEPPEGVSPLLKISSLLLGMVVSLLRFVAILFQYSCFSGPWAEQAHRYFGNWKRQDVVTANHSPILKLSYSILSARTSHFFGPGSLFFPKNMEIPAVRAGTTDIQMPQLLCWTLAFSKQLHQYPIAATSLRLYSSL